MSERKIELNQFGLSVWKHKTNKRLFLEQSYRWKDNLVLLDETEGRQIVDSFKASTFDYSAWEPMTTEEYEKVISNYKEIYEQIIPQIKINLEEVFMNEQFVTHEIALKLKELGFDEECFCFYTDSKQLRYNFILDSENPKLIPNSKINVLNYCAAPLWQQAIEWIKKTYNICIDIIYQGGLFSDTFDYAYMIWSKQSIPQSNKMKYNKAREQAILKTIDICKTN